MAKLAFIGLGVMGYPMAGHLARAGHDVCVYNRTAPKAEAWAEEYGGQSAASPAEAAAGAGLVFTCVGNDDDVRAVVLGVAGALAGMQAGAVLVDHTTASADLARELEEAGVDVIQFDEPAFNVFMDDVKDWGIEALHRAIDGLTCTTAVHICYGYGIKANIDWKNALGSEWRQYEEIFPALNASRIDQVSLECINSRVPLSLMGLLPDKDVLVGAIDVATNEIETPEQVAAALRSAMGHVAPERLVACTNCGFAPLPRRVTEEKLKALGAGAALLRKEL